MDASVQANIQPAATKVTDMAYLSFREPDYRFTFGLASGEVYMAFSVTRESVGSYPAFPPLLA